MPILLGGGVPLVPELSARVELQLVGQKTYEKTGTSESRVRGEEAPRRVAVLTPRQGGDDMRGDRWGIAGPPDEAYSRVTNPERFQPLHDSTAYNPH